MIQQGHHVVGLDNFDPFYPRSAKEANLEALGAVDNFQLIEGDIRNDEQVNAVVAPRDIEIIIHLAAKAGVRPSIQDPKTYQDVNCNGAGYSVR